jgi:hypothetical protein
MRKVQRLRKQRCCAERLDNASVAYNNAPRPRREFLIRTGTPVSFSEDFFDSGMAGMPALAGTTAYPTQSFHYSS